MNWTAAAVAAPMTLIGGYLGARIARFVNETALRWCVVGLGVAFAVYQIARR